ncbi:MAG: hypothetical protein HY763_07620 [Planctomycetes bacterium]|nr:hypothetical protein [Planctomycetota bacterium]
MPTHRCQCGATYRFAAEAAGKKAKCNKCGAVFQLDDGKADTGVIAVAGEPTDDSELSEALSRAEAYKRAAAHARAAGLKDAAASQVADADAEPVLAADAHALHGLLEDLLWVFLFPTSLENLFIFLGIWVYASLASFVWILAVLFYLWFSAYCFDVIQTAASGERSLPELMFTRGAIVDYLAATLKWAASWLYVLAPLLAYMIIRWAGDSPLPVGFLQLVKGTLPVLVETGRADAVFAFLTVLAVACWPMAVVCLALGGMETLSRVDLLMVTLARTAGGYVLVLVFVVGAHCVGHYAGEAFKAAVSVGAGGGSIGSWILARFLADGLKVYLTLVSMQAIGFFYRRYRYRFAWDWG